MWKNIGSNKKLFTQIMCFLDTGLKVGQAEIVIAHPQAVPGQSGIDSVSAISKGVAHVFDQSGGGE